MTDMASHVAGGVRQRRRKRDRVKGLFDDLSVAQVLAGAMAAVTSMLLASQIGIYGSVIGVGVGSVISAVASQLYKKFLSASADKIREVGGHGDGNAEPEGRDVRFVEDDSAATIALPAVAPGSSASETIAFRAVDAGASSADTTVLPAVGQNQAAMHTVVLSAATSAPFSAKAKPADGGRASAFDTAMYKDANRVRAQAARRRKERTKQRVLVVSVVSALVAVVLSAAAITVITQGEGMGEKPQHFVSAIQDAGGSDAQVLGSSPSNTDQAQSREDGAVQTPATSGDGADGAPGAETDAGSSGEGSASGSSGSSGDAAVGGSGQNGSGGSGDGASSDSGGESGQTGAGADVSGGSQDGTNASGGTGTSE